MPAPRSNGNAPPSVLDALHAAAPRREVNSCIPVHTYYRSAFNLQRQAEEYRRTRNQEQLYLMLLRYASLVLETIPRHSDYRKNDASYQHLLLTSKQIMEELEQLKLKIRLQDRARLEEAPYMPTAAPGATRFDKLRQEDAASLDSLGTPQWAQRMAAEGGGGGGGGGTVAGSLAALTISPASSRLLEMPDLRPSFALPPASGQMLSKHALSYPSTSTTTSNNSKVYGASTNAPHAAPPPPPPVPTYSELLASLNNGNTDATTILAPSPYGGELLLGPQQLAIQTAPYPTAPLPPGATCCPPPPYSTSSENISPPSQSQSSAITTQPSGGGIGEVRQRQRIRDVHLSASLMKEFLRYAASNTSRGIESCGILAGSLSPDDARFTITALIIPKQEGSSDTVQALAEEETFEVQDSLALYSLGWIHTHPTQSCFLSSVDVHTQCGYQTMLDEAVAIVMAPSQSRNQMGVFRLTTPGGLTMVQQCPLRGFHSHPQTSTGQPLYEECSNVYLNERIGYKVIDLR